MDRIRHHASLWTLLSTYPSKPYTPCSCPQNPPRDRPFLRFCWTVPYSSWKRTVFALWFTSNVWASTAVSPGSFLSTSALANCKTAPVSPLCEPRDIFVSWFTKTFWSLLLISNAFPPLSKIIATKWLGSSTSPFMLLFHTTAFDPPRFRFFWSLSTVRLDCLPWMAAYFCCLNK